MMEPPAPGPRAGSAALAVCQPRQVDVDSRPAGMLGMTSSLLKLVVPAWRRRWVQPAELRHAVIERLLRARSADVGWAAPIRRAQRLDFLDSSGPGPPGAASGYGKTQPAGTVDGDDDPRPTWASRDRVAAGPGRAPPPVMKQPCLTLFP